MSNAPIKISVVIPSYNSANTLHQCLQALSKNSLNEAEIIVVDDHSTDGSASIAEKFEVKVFTNDRRKGPAAARNFGANHARGGILFFVDSDVCVTSTAIEDVLHIFEKDPDLSAVFGSYDTMPSAKNFLSQYKNLFHHYVHQTSHEEAATFWAGCGAVCKNVFDSIGGFNEKDYPNASIEDIELGLRLWTHHYRVRLEKSLQAKHLKRWTWAGLLKADISHRAYPWSRLILQNDALPNDLNLQTSHRISAVLVGLLAMLIFFGVFSYLWLDHTLLMPLLWFMGFILVALIILNRDLYRFFMKQRGVFFALLTIPWHLFYYLYSGMTFVVCWFLHKLKLSSPLQNIRNVSARNVNH